MSKKYIVTNFAYGTGTYLRTTDLAIAFNAEYEKQTRRRLGILVPWVYGEKQKRVMLEEFEEYEKKHPGEIVLDAKLGALLKSVFYGDASYGEALSGWIKNAKAVSDEARKHLTGLISGETLSGAPVFFSGKESIVVELNRSPRVRYDIAPSYFTSFAYIGEILERSIDIKDIAVSEELFRAGIPVADWVEKNHCIHAIAYPATFSFLDGRGKRYETEVETPPIAPLPKVDTSKMEKGVFVTVTGIPGLERLYKEARELGLRLYSNDIKVVEGATWALPHVIGNPSMEFQFARAGWSSVWISMVTGTPLFVPEFDSNDDPEIYWNNKSVETLSLGRVYRAESLQELLNDAPKLRGASGVICEEIKKRFGTLDGNQYCASLFVADFLKNLN